MATSKQYDLRVEGLNELLRSFRKLGPEASKELRNASKRIAQNRMVPAYQAAALNYGGPWGQVLADSVKAGSDRLPKVTIGGARRRFSGGASATMVRYPVDSGDAGNSFAPFERTRWLQKGGSYKRDAFKDWNKAVGQLVNKWERLA